MAADKLYTARGEPIRNVDAYVQAGGRPTNAAGTTIHNPTAYQNSIEASIRQNTDDPKYLYHYTSQQVAESISDTGRIQASGDGLAGRGTYLTAKPPRCKSDTLLSNNYGSSGARDASFVDQYVRMDADHLSAEHVGGSRDVWKVEGDVDVGRHSGFVDERGQQHHSYSGGEYHYNDTTRMDDETNNGGYEEDLNVQSYHDNGDYYDDDDYDDDYY